jgi:hypothetical protein
LQYILTSHTDSNEFSTVSTRSGIDEPNLIAAHRRAILDVEAVIALALRGGIHR